MASKHVKPSRQSDGTMHMVVHSKMAPHKFGRKKKEPKIEIRLLDGDVHMWDDAVPRAANRLEGTVGVGN